MTVISTQQIYAGYFRELYESHVKRARKINLINEIISKNALVFRKKQASHRKVILNRLGWIDIVREIPPEIERFERLVHSVKEDGISHVFVLGMGGSSLCPEVFGKVFGKRRWLKSYTIVDTTAPSQLDAIIDKTDFRKAFFIVSSKSGTTIETASHFRFFFRLIKSIRPLKAGHYFAAITDAESELHRIARRNRFREIFLNQPDIGGRYSALSYFGLVPGAFTGLDIARLLEGAGQQLTLMETHGNSCDALKLGLLLGCCALKGHDKLRLITTERLAPLVAWIEQLVAESTGKESKGIIPVDDIGDDADSSDETVDVYLSIRGDKWGTSKPPTERGRGNPYAVIKLPDPVCIGAEMLKWEMATAVAATVLAVNPFDEPNVAESKKNTAAILRGRRGPRKDIRVTPLVAMPEMDVLSAVGVSRLGRRRSISPEEILTGLFSGMGKGDYLAVLCYMEMTDRIERELTALRRAVADKTGRIVLRGYGPRFLHSTGQLFKGGAQKGHFLVLERNYLTDYAIPGTNISFARLIKAQAQGDIKALVKRKRPVVSINVKFDPVAGLRTLAEIVESL